MNDEQLQHWCESERRILQQLINANHYNHHMYDREMRILRLTPVIVFTPIIIFTAVLEWVSKLF